MNPEIESYISAEMEEIRDHLRFLHEQLDAIEAAEEPAAPEPSNRWWALIDKAADAWHYLVIAGLVGLIIYLYL